MKFQSFTPKSDLQFTPNNLTFFPAVINGEKMNMKNTIVIEGLDGAGTTTQMRLIAKRLEDEGKKVFITHEPTDYPIGRMVREVLQKKIKTTPEALALLFSADRDDHLYNKEYGLEKMIDDGFIIVTDRYKYSSIAYQGAECDIEYIKAINSRFPHPSHLIFVDTTPEACMERIEKRGCEKELFERLEFLKKVRENYIEQFSSLPEEVNYLYINGDKAIEEVEEEIWSWLKTTNLL